MKEVRRKLVCQRPLSICECCSCRRYISKEVALEQQLICVHSTARNSLESPLLRLPAEIRNQIWDLVYDGMAVAVRHTSTKTRMIVRDNRGVGVAFRDHCRTPDLICKQYWAEASAIALGKYCFYFSTPEELYAFVSTSGPYIARIRQIELELDLDMGEKSRNEVQWVKALSSCTSDRFESLEDVTLVCMLWVPDHVRLAQDGELMENQILQKCGLTTIIQILQQHRLKEELVTIYIDSYSEINIFYHPQIEAALRRHLLDYQGRVYREAS